MTAVVQSSASKDHRFHVLDGMRGVAALLVVFQHYYHPFFSVYFPNAFISVDFFFILSGFVVYYAYAERIVAGQPAREYLVRRLARLFPMMALGIALGAGRLGNSNRTR